MLLDVKRNGTGPKWTTPRLWATDDSTTTQTTPRLKATDDSTTTQTGLQKTSRKWTTPALWATDSWATRRLFKSDDADLLDDLVNNNMEYDSKETTNTPTTTYSSTTTTRTSKT